MNKQAQQEEVNKEVEGEGTKRQKKRRAQRGTRGVNKEVEGEGTKRHKRK